MQKGLNYRVAALMAISFLAQLALLPASFAAEKSSEEKFFWAISYDKVAEIKALRKKGVSPNARTAEILNQTALSWALTRNSYKAAFLLLESGADPNLKDDENDSAFTWAVQIGHGDLVKAMLDKGADPNALIPRGYSDSIPVLINAIGGKNTGVTKALINAGANVNIKDGRGRTPLFHARRLKWQEIILLLESKGAKP